MQLILSTLIFSAALLTAAASAAQPAANPSPEITVSGEGSIKATPDRAWVRIATESRSKVAKEAQQRNADVMTAVQQKLTALGIPADAVRTVGIDLQPEFDFRDGRQTLRGYVARNNIEVRIDDFARVGDVVDAAVGSGATTVHDLRFDVKNRAALERAALQRAVESALEKAAALAAGLKRSIDRVLRVEESFAAPPQPMERGMMMRMEVAAATTPVAAGEIEIVAQVRLTAAVK